jgi:hypothetical protein
LLSAQSLHLAFTDIQILEFVHSLILVFAAAQHHKSILEQLQLQLHAFNDLRTFDGDDLLFHSLKSPLHSIGHESKAPSGDGHFKVREIE